MLCLHAQLFHDAAVFSNCSVVTASFERNKETRSAMVSIHESTTPSVLAQSLLCALSSGNWSWSRANARIDNSANAS